jgi:hypothetical protein
VRVYTFTPEVLDRPQSLFEATPLLVLSGMAIKRFVDGTGWRIYTTPFTFDFLESEKH